MSVQEIDGFALTQPEPCEVAVKRRKPTVANGYAAMPGTGPEGETCGTCKHHAIRMYSQRYHKCALVRGKWTAGTATDIRVGSPACRRWETE